MKLAQAQSTPLAVSAGRQSVWFRPTAIVLAGSALVALCAHLSIPLYFTPVPLSLGSFAVLLLGLALPPRLAAATLGAYLAEGALGLPVFAPSPHLLNGFARLAGPTGGYLLCYPLAAALISILWRQSRPRFASAACSAAAGSLAILASGALWLALLTHASAASVLTLAVLPFVPGDALKIASAAAFTAGFNRLRRHHT